MSNSCRIIRKNATVEVKEEKDKEDLDKTISGDLKGLACVGRLHGTFWVFDPNADSPNASQEKLWLVLRNEENKNYQGVKLQLNDIIKLGKSEYLVKEYVKESPVKTETIVKADPEPNPIKEQDIKVEIAKNAGPNKDEIQIVDGSQPPIAREDFRKTLDGEKLSRAFTISDKHPLFLQEEEKESNAKSPGNCLGKDKESEVQCRVCLGKENTKDRPLISSPCKCIGSIQYIHSKCLQEWLKSKVTETHSTCAVSYTYPEFECDVCKSKYPDSFELPNGQNLGIIDFQKPQSNYMVLETLYNGNQPKSN